ncbi:SpoIIE family protein phosphatase [uncultured Paludibaculum sp.]|uniref:SpoIIE family protein phosphatase n=1 Tax=uncultured Paludibaculum sp. TaxID=1765020 RepID=UPI002AAA9DB9|nr:SpoIIE family protein phosphatase [uncultured Paludibaculum sp.]
MAETPRILRVVVASPGDVQRERDLVPAVLEELNRSICVDRNLRLEAVRWETDAYPGFHLDGPQHLIDGVLKIDDCDLLIGLFWKRFGTPVDDASSGTEHEIRNAIAAWRRKGLPQVMVYFNQKAYKPRNKSEADQWGQVLQFQEEFPKEGLWWPYAGPGKFEAILRRHLTAYVRAAFPIAGAPAAPRSPAAAQPAVGEAYFSVQTAIIEEKSTSFVGGEDALHAFDSFQRKHSRGYFIIRGSPGQGKTALACRLIASANYVHHFINRMGGRDEPRLILLSLLAQLDPAGSAELKGESLATLTKAFEDCLRRVAGVRKPLVLVVDALDELPESPADPPFLPAETLPEGVFVVVTSRPGHHLNRLQQRLFSLPHEVFILRPLGLEEMRAIIGRSRPGTSASELERIAEASQGNPLYLQAVLDQFRADFDYDLTKLPTTIEGFFRAATRSLAAGNTLLSDVLGLLSVARKTLSLRELSQITGSPQRAIDETAIRPILPFLLGNEEGFGFYHASFHQFVRRALLYEDELKNAHRAMAEWLERPENLINSYRYHSLAHHLFEAGAQARLVDVIDEGFLSRAAQLLGYSALESLELLTRALLERHDPSVIARCVTLVESLRGVIGQQAVSEVANTLQPYRSGPLAFRTQLLEPHIAEAAGLDIYVGILPKAEVPADFFEIVSQEQRLFLAIGDAPSLGLKSAFVARFMGNLFRNLVLEGNCRDMGAILAAMDQMISPYEYFRRISMQCIAVDPKRRVIRLANAGHPNPVHYSSRTGRCELLPLAGNLLNSASGVAPWFEEYAVEVGNGDILVLVSDGLTEGHVLVGEPYGYRFQEIVVKNADAGARAVGEAILDAWRRHPREADAVDDVTVVAIQVDLGQGAGER